MKKKYQSLAQEIVKNLGGKENISNAYHCQTRLRFTLKDEGIVKDEVVGSIDGVVKVIRNAGVYQVVIGTHVADVFEEVEKMIDTDYEGKSEKIPNEKKKVIASIIDFVASVFQPVVPALAGAGMVKALLALLVVFKLTSSSSQTYQILSFFADGVFYFLPMILALTTAQKVKCNPILAVGVAAMMLHPNWISMVGAEDAVHLFGVVPFTLTSYGSSVIPIILIILVQSYVEKGLKKIIPKSVELVFVPMLTFLFMGTLAFSCLGPIGTILGNYLAIFFTFLSETAAWAPAVLIGGFLPILVIFGLHNGVAPLGVMQMGKLGYDSIFGPGCVCSNMAQAAAGTVVALRTKNKKTKTISTSGSITAYMGITEPILYGVNLPKKYPLVASMIGGGLGGLYAGLTQTHRFATGSSGLPAIFLYLGDDTTKYFVNIIIAIIISIVVSAVLTFILSFKFEKEESGAVIKEISDKKTTFVQSPVKGKILSLSNAADEAFASGALGQGIVIEPSEGVVVAPFDATVTVIFPTKHAIGLTSESGVELLIHVGVDTVNMNGEGFKSFVEQGVNVVAGQRLVEFDSMRIKEAGYSDQVIVVVTNSNDFSEIDTNIDTMNNDAVIAIKRS